MVISALQHPWKQSFIKFARVQIEGEAFYLSKTINTFATKNLVLKVIDIAQKVFFIGYEAVGDFICLMIFITELSYSRKQLIYVHF